MGTQISQKNLKQITEGIRNKYSKVADSPQGQFRYPTGRNGLEALKYEAALIDMLPDEVAASYCGVGNPFSLGAIRKGDAVLDIGCGAGVDTILAAMMTGAEGKSVGVDIVPEMLQRAEANLSRMDLKNVTFQSATGEHLPFPDNHFDAVISNGVINLIPDKDAAIREIFRVQKAGGSLMIADQVMVGGTLKSLKDRLSSWFQ
ncbi:MAG: methyltransferase domain-containing protein [Desulfatirhabdiaceae bacterium]|nr:methyltransferase domain-containing protein [Desulfatirhabdiaceae bacterium]